MPQLPVPNENADRTFSCYFFIFFFIFALPETMDNIQNVGHFHYICCYVLNFVLPGWVFKF